MKDKIELRQEISKFIPRINSSKNIFELFRHLNYPKEVIFDETYKRKLEEFDFKKEEKDKINNIYTVLSFEKNLSVFLIETKTLAPAFIRYIAKVFSDRYMRCLLIITINYTDIIIVFPDYEKVEVGKHKLKITKLYLSKEEIYYTDLETLSNIFYEGKEATWRDVWYKWREAFNVEKVTEKFFGDYQDIFFMLRKALEKQKINTKYAHEFTLQFLNRVMFIYFVSKKRWLNENLKFMKWFWTRYKEERNKGAFDKDSFYEKWLRVIFFEVFNNMPYALKELPTDVMEALSNVPFLNGGLFRETDTDKLPIKIEDSLFKKIFNFFEKYNFTIKEDMPLEKEVAINPQMIGYVYESLANVAEEIYDRTDLGIFYTPRVEVDFMCRRSLVEYLSKHLSDISKDRIYEFVFDEDKEKIEKHFDEKKYWYKLEEVLDNLSVIDPACGSGAFLVGMLNVLAELYKIIYKHLNRKLTDFQLKNNIINRSLYGVDVMPWAVHAAELRLWLQLIIETEFKKEELREKALLPTLNLNLRVGDSLVQEIGGINLHLREPGISNRLKKKLYDLRIEKEKYFNNDPTAKFKVKEELVGEETRIFEEIIDERISVLKTKEQTLKKALEKLRKTKQVSFSGEVAEAEQKKIINVQEIKKKNLEQIMKKVAELENVKTCLHEPEKKPFVWEIDFAEIFGDKNGFDIVIGNPPYVRQEKISPPNRLKAEVTLEDRREYKEKLIKSVHAHFPVIKKMDKKSDYYIYFYFHGLNLLNEKGTFCFITSNSWLDVGYGKNLQEFLLKYAPIKAIYDNQAKRSFAHADINTIIAVFDAPKVSVERIEEWTPQDSKMSALNNIAKFIMFKKPFEEVINTKNLLSIENATEILKRDCFRVYPIKHEDLMEDGWEYLEDYDSKKDGKFKKGKYTGNKWGGKYLRAPDIFYTILEKGKGKLVRLGDIADVRFGIKTGANEFFYLPSKYFDIKEEGEYYRLIPKQDGLPVDIRIEKEFLMPVIKSLRQIKKESVDLNDTTHKIFYCQRSKEELNDTNALKYIEWGEEQGLQNRPTCASRNNWYAIHERKISQLLYSYILGARHLIPLNNLCLADNNLFDIYCDQEKADNLFISLNSTICRLFLENLGREMTGALAVLKIQIYELESLLIVNVITNKNVRKQVNRPIKSIFEECGIDPNKPIREQEPNPLPDRAELDNIIFDELGLTEEERKEVYWAVCELVKQRLEKARSLNGK